MPRGDVVLVPFPFPDGTGGKTRPAIIVNEPVADPDRDALLVAVSSRSLATGPGDYLLPDTHPEFRRTGLRMSSSIRCGKIATINELRILRRLGTAGPGLMDEIERRLRVVFQLST